MNISNENDKNAPPSYGVWCLGHMVVLGDLSLIDLGTRLLNRKWEKTWKEDGVVGPTFSRK